jgi:hypothetical protein
LCVAKIRNQTDIVHIYVLNIHTGVVDTSIDLPVGSPSTELAVVEGGIVVRSDHQLRFLTKQFTPVSPDVALPVLIPPRLWGGEGGTKDWLKLFVSADASKFVVSCENGRTKRYYLFDGQSFAVKNTATITELITAESFGDNTLLFRSNDDTTSVRAVHFGDTDSQQSSLTYSAHKGTCAEAVYIDAQRFLNVCDGLSVIEEATGREIIIEKLPKGEVEASNGILSEDKSHAIVSRHLYKGGSSFFDIEPRTTGAVVKVFDLASKELVLRIPIMPIPREILDYLFAGKTTLIVMNDDEVSAYNVPR